MVKGMTLNPKELEYANNLIKVMCLDIDKNIILNNRQVKDKEKEEYLASLS